MREPYVLTVGTIEPRKDLPTLVQAVEQFARSALRPVVGRRRSAGLGNRARARPAVHARARRAAVVGGRRALSPGPRVLLCIVVRGFRLPRSRGDGARRRDGRDHRIRARGTGAGGGTAVRDRAMWPAVPARSAGSSTTRSCAASCAASGRARAPRTSTWERAAAAHADAFARVLDAFALRRLPPCVSCSTSRRCRRARSARACTPTAIARGLATRPDVELHLAGPHERRGALAAARRGRMRARRRPRAAAGAASRGSRRARRACARAVAPDVWHGPHYTMPLRVACPTVVTMHDLTFFDHPEWHERSKVVFFRRMIARRGPPRGRARVRQRVHRRAPARALHTARARSWSCTTASTTHASRPSPDAARPRRARRARHPHAVHRVRGHDRAAQGRAHARARVRAHRDAHPELQLVLAGGDGWGAEAVRDAIARERRRNADPAARLPRRRDGRRRFSAVPRSSPTRRSKRGSACRRSRRSRAARRSSRRGLRARRGRRRRRAARSRRAMSRTWRARWRPRSTTTRLPSKLRAAGPARAAAFTWERSLDGPRRRLPAARSATSAPIDEGARHRRDGFVGPYLLARHLQRRCGDDVVDARAMSASVDGFDITDRAAVHDVFGGAPARGRVPPGRVRRTSASRGATRRRRLRVNVEGTANVLDAARAAHVRRVLVVGSAEEYGRVDDTSTPTPRRRAAAADDAVRREQDRGVVPRAASVARRRARDGTRPGVLAHRSGSVRPVRRARAGGAASRRRSRDGRDEIPVGDRSIRYATSATCATSCARTGCSCEHGEPGEVYNVATGMGVSIRDVVADSSSRRRAPCGWCVDEHSCDRSTCRGSSATPPSCAPATGWAPQHSLDEHTRRMCWRTRSCAPVRVLDGRASPGASRSRGGRGAAGARRWRTMRRSTPSPAASKSSRASSTGTTSSALPCTSSQGRGATRLAAPTGSRFAIARIHAAGSAG